MITNLERIKGALIGVVCGDSMGMPFESLSSTQVKEIVGEELKTYWAPQQKGIFDTMNLKPGETTDDWQISKISAQSFIDSGGFDIIDQALKRVEALNTSTIGWGRSTYNGVKQIKRYFETFGKEGVSPQRGLKPTISEGKGCGNGIAMACSPFALFQLEGEAIANESLFQLGFLTHQDPRASIAALQVVEEIWRAGTSDNRTVSWSVSFMEKKYNNTDFSTKMTIADACKDEQELLEKVGAGCFAMESVPFAISISRRYKDNFRKAISACVLAGSDADSTAAICGALVGANVGIQGIPEEWILPWHDEVLKLAEKFYEVSKDLRPRRLSGGFVRA